MSLCNNGGNVQLTCQLQVNCRQDMESHKSFRMCYSACSITPSDNNRFQCTNIFVLPPRRVPPPEDGCYSSLFGQRIATSMKVVSTSCLVSPLGCSCDSNRSISCVPMNISMSCSEYPVHICVEYAVNTSL